MVCRWCGETANSEITAREMMFGFRDRFVYEKCSACGGLQIQDIPEVIALSKYYPAEFWSHKLAEKNALIPEWLNYGVLRWLLDDRYAKLISLIPSPSLRSAFWRALKYRIKSDHKVLDVGCGTGSLICALADIGIKAPIGVDPFIEPSTITY